MKFLVSKDIHSNPNFILLLGFYALMLLLYLIGDLFYLSHFFGSSVEEVLFTLKGNPDEYVEALSLMSLLEHLHISLFLAVFALFSIMAIVLRMRLEHNHKGFIISLSMASLLLSFLSLLATYFLAEFFVYGFFYLSLLWHFSGAYALVIILLQVWFKKS